MVLVSTLLFFLLCSFSIDNVQADAKLPLIKGRIYTTIPKVSKSWAVVFYVYPMAKTECMTNLLHYTTGTDTGPATRIPGVWLFSKTTSLYICSPVNGKRFCFKTREELALNKWHHVVLEQVHDTHQTHRLKLLVNGKLLLNKINRNPREYTNVKGYISDAWFPPAKAFVRRVIHENLEKGYLVEKGRLISSINNVRKAWELTFDVKILSSSSSISNILHITTGTKNVMLPAIHLLPTTNKLRICSNINGNTASCFDSSPIKLGKFTNIKIKQFHYSHKTFRYQIFINRRLVYTVDNKQAVVSGNIKIYVSNPWQDEVLAHISGVRFKKLPKGYPVLKNNLIDRITKQSRSWSVEFRIKPFGTVRGWSNVLHLTQGSDTSRLPAVFIRSNSYILHICSNINNNRNHCVNRPIPRNKFTRVQIIQLYVGPNAHRYVVAFDSRKVYSVINRKAKSFTNVKVFNGDNFYPPAKAYFKSYKFKNLEVDGQWSRFGPYGKCSEPCGPGIQIKTRTCTNPSPKYGGKSCPGSATSAKPCQIKPCPVNGNWSSFGPYGNCSEPCGPGFQTRTRTCTNPSPKYGGKDCSGSPNSTKPCEIKKCPIHGNWSSFGPYGTCSKTCGLGIQTRTRTCTNPRPQYGGRKCSGSAKSTKSCKIRECPYWSNWSPYRQCTALCGPGTQTRTRTCINSPGCPGSATSSRPCNLRVCPTWTSWTSWNSCSARCEGGRRIRRRTCQNAFPGRTCPGSSYQTQSCKKQRCTCQNGWTERHGICYGYVGQKKNWYDAEQHCRSRGGHLPSIHSNTENTDVYATYPGHQTIWIGMTDSAHEGAWRWVDGSSVTYTNFRSGEPNDANGGEDCMSFWADSSRKWNDMRCRLAFNFVCKASRQNNRPM